MICTVDMFAGANVASDVLSTVANVARLCAVCRCEYCVCMGCLQVRLLRVYVLSTGANVG